MDLEIIITKWNKSEKDKHYMVSLICGILKIWYKHTHTHKSYDTNELTRQKQTHRLWNQTYGYQKRKM